MPPSQLLRLREVVFDTPSSGCPSIASTPSPLVLVLTSCDMRTAAVAEAPAAAAARGDRSCTSDATLLIRPRDRTVPSCASSGSEVRPGGTGHATRGVDCSEALLAISTAPRTLKALSAVTGRGYGSKTRQLLIHRMHCSELTPLMPRDLLGGVKAVASDPRKGLPS